MHPLHPIGAQMNVAYAVAMALLDGNVLIDRFSADWINGDDVWNLIDRTHTHHERPRAPVDRGLAMAVTR